MNLQSGASKKAVLFLILGGKMRRPALVTVLIALLSFVLTYSLPVRADNDRDERDRDDHIDAAAKVKTATPIKHLIVIFGENNSFDHYFGTYPKAANPAGEPAFHPSQDTPLINGFTFPLLNNNLNAKNPFRIDPILMPAGLTCDNDNHYSDEQTAFDGGLLDRFSVTSVAVTLACPTADLAMGYFDGNTVTALWNYAQHYAMSDNFFDSEFGTTVMGHLNLISGQTHGLTIGVGPAGGNLAKQADGSYAVIGNVEVYWDNCPNAKTPRVYMNGKNVGDLMNAASVTWGWFYGDFGANSCPANFNNHYDPFLYYASTANPNHTPPASPSVIGHSDCAPAVPPNPPLNCSNHSYDLSYFQTALDTGNLPSVSFVKAPFGFTGHPADGSPLQEQTFLVNTINSIERSRYWGDTAIVIAYDDSDGWYDHVMPPIVNPSHDAAHDTLFGANLCGPAVNVLVNGVPVPAYQDRCGYGERLPFLVISPYARRNYVDHSINDTTSILRFIEDNWSLGRIGDQSFDSIAGSLLGMFDFDHDHSDDRDSDSRRVILDPTTGEVVHY
jgi:phospholipase C